MGGLRMTRNDLATYDLLSRAGSDAKNGMLQYGLSRAADVKPETVTSTALTDTTPNTDSMVYDSDTGQYLPKYMDGGKPTEQALVQLNTPADGVSAAPEGMRPRFSAQTTTRHKLGDKEQDTPFLPEQVDAQRFRNQADVYTRAGMADKAAALHGLAKGRDEEGRSNAVREAFRTGMSKHADLLPLERQFKGIDYAQNTAFQQGDFATWDKLRAASEELRGKLRNDAVDRADIISDPRARLVAYANAYKYVFDGRNSASVSDNPDGSWRVDFDNGTALERVTKDDLPRIGMYFRDTAAVRKLEQDAAIKARDRMLAREDKAWEYQNKPIELGKGASIVIPGGGGGGASKTIAGGGGEFDVKEHLPVLKEIDRMFLERGANFDALTGKWNYRPEEIANSALGQRLYKAIPILTPSQTVDIVDNGKAGTRLLSIDGTSAPVEGFAHKGLFYPLTPGIGPVKIDSEPTKDASVPFSKARAFSGLQNPETFGLTRKRMGAPDPAFTRASELDGRRGGGTISGMRKASATPTPPDFPSVSADQQAERNNERRAILIRELATYPKGDPGRRELEDEARRAGILVPN